MRIWQNEVPLMIQVFAALQGLAASTSVVLMGRRSVDLAKQALSSVHSKVTAAMEPIIIVAFPNQEV